MAYARNRGIKVRIARFQNCYGPEGTWTGGREKAPAAICRKVAIAVEGGQIEVWGDGSAVRSYTFIDDMINGIYLLMQSDLEGAVNIGCPEYVTVDQLVETVAEVAGKKIEINTSKVQLVSNQEISVMNGYIHLDGSPNSIYMQVLSVHTPGSRRRWKTRDNLKNKCEIHLSLGFPILISS